MPRRLGRSREGKRRRRSREGASKPGSVLRRLRQVELHTEKINRENPPQCLLLFLGGGCPAPPRSGLHWSPGINRNAPIKPGGKGRGVASRGELAGESPRPPQVFLLGLAGSPRGRRGGSREGAGEGWEAAVRELLGAEGASPAACQGVAGGPNWPPCAASSCSAARRAPSRSWSRSHRRRRRWRCPWGWCRGCCPRDSWPGAGRWLGLFPVRVL